MHRCYVNPEGWQDDIIIPTPDEKHHLLDVVRAGAGDIVEVFDGRGRSAQVKLAKNYGEDVLCIIPGTAQIQKANTEIILIVALPKGKRMDLIVEKATELGVSEIRPVITERVISRPDDERLSERAERWRRIAVSAAKQCGIDKIPSVAPVRTYREALEEVMSIDLILIGALDAAPGTMHSAIEQFLNSERGNKISSSKIALLIGPEGDFTAEEMKMACDSGAWPVSFGELTLRVETAALYGLCALRYALSK